MDFPGIVDLGLPRRTLKLIPMRDVLRMLLKPREKWTRIPKRRNPAGSKLLRKFAKAKTGTRHTYDAALSYYSQLK